MNPVEDSDLLLRLSSLDAGAFATLYDRHAAAVYGYALLVTRKPKDARRVLARTFTALARSPERASTAGSLRRPLLALARPLAWDYRSRRRWFRKKASFALDPSAPEELRKRLDAEPDDSAEEAALRAVEGFGIRQLQSEGALFAGVDKPVEGARWKSPPRSMRSLVLLKASDAARPGRRYLRWLALWSLVAGAFFVALATERATPRIPRSSFTVPENVVVRSVDEMLKKRRSRYEILQGFREEGRK
jgi:DNA-directed RNA polymerase specialized sigma24 family protein